MAVQNFDKLNILKRRSIPYEQYFGDMELSPKQKKERIDLAYLLEDILIIYFMLMQESMTSGNLNEVSIKQNLMYDLYEKLSDGNYFGEPEDTKAEEVFDKYVSDLIDEVYDSTITNSEKSPNDYDYTGEQPYWTSDDRAKFIAENEANTLYNSKDYVDAVKQGKTHKIWMAYPDDRVRPTHVETNGSKIPIDAYFTVGNARMLYPKDVTSEFSTGGDYPEEVVNCRCSVSYV